MLGPLLVLLLISLSNLRCPDGNCDDGEPSLQELDTHPQDTGIDSEHDGGAGDGGAGDGGGPGDGGDGGDGGDADGGGSDGGGDGGGDGGADGGDDGGYSGPVEWSGTYDLMDLAVELSGELNGEHTGKSIEADADLNGDGVLDIVVGASHYMSFTGRVFVVYGPVSSDEDLVDAEGIIEGDALSGYLGESLAISEDLDGDDYRDIFVSAPQAMGTDAGKVAAAPWDGRSITPT